MKKIVLSNLAIIFIVSFFISCEKDDNEKSNFENGVYILNEGDMSKSNASVSFLNYETDLISDDIFMEVNQRPLGAVLNNACISGDKIYMVLNASGKIEVANASDFEELNVIEGFVNPRYISTSDNKAYVTQWNNMTDTKGAVKVVDLKTNSITKTIDAGTGPEGILSTSKNVWVANGGGYMVDSTVMVINAIDDKILKTIVVGHNPKELVKDSNGNIWVLCYGYVEYAADYSISRETPSKLVCISASTYEIIKTINIADNLHPQHLDISSDGKTVYYGAGYGFNGIFAVSIDSESAPSAPIVEGMFYGFNVNPQNDEIYACEAPSFTDPGKLIRYKQSGEKIKEYTVGIGPNGVIFK